MTWQELETLIRDRAKAQPRGWQTQLAERLGVSQPTVAQFLTGRRGVPPAHLDIILDALDLELDVRSKQRS